jgi:hypothetical protein
MTAFVLAALKSPTAWKIAGGVGLALAAWWWVGSVKADAYAAGDKAGAARVQATLDQERAGWACERTRAAEAALQASEDARAEEARRTAAHRQEIARAQATVARLQAHAAAAGAADLRLRERIAAFAAQARQAGGDPAATGRSETASDPIGVFAVVLNRCSERIRLLAELADRRGAAGEACERAYDALTPPAGGPE